MRMNRDFGIASMLALAVRSSATPPTGAGQLDRELIRNAGPIIDYLGKYEVKNVGILPFEVKEGSREASFDSAPLARTMPVRLEKTLIMALDEDSFGIVRNPAGTTARAKVGSYLTKKADLDKLFAAKYDLAWEGAKVGVDRFLSGRVETSVKDRSKTTVFIEAFTRASWEDGKVVLEPVLEFEVPTDRTLLADQGYNFALSRSALSPKVEPTERTKLAVRLIARREIGGKAHEGGSIATPDDVAGFASEVRYDNEKQQTEEVRSPKAGQKAPEYVVVAHPPGAKITLHLKRTDEGDAPLGLVLEVNGLSTCDTVDADSQLCRRRVYGPDLVGKSEAYEGFYPGADASSLLRFESVGSEEAKGIDKLGARTGWLDIDVFASLRKKKPKLSPEEEEESDAPLTMTRSLPRATRKGAKFVDYQKSLFSANRQQREKSPVRKRSAEGIIYHPTAPVAVPPTSEALLPNPELIKHLSIRYL